MKNQTISGTPLKDAYKARLNNLNQTDLITDPAKLVIGAYACLRTKYNQNYTGFVTSIGPKNVKIESPYGGYADSDYISIQELKFEKSLILSFYLPE